MKGGIERPDGGAPRHRKAEDSAVSTAVEAVSGSARPEETLRSLFRTDRVLGLETALHLSQAANSSLRRAAADLLGLDEGRRAVDRLVALLADPDVHVRIHARNALVDIGNLVVVDALLERLRDTEGAELLGRIEILGALLETQGPLFVTRHRLPVDRMVAAVSEVFRDAEPAARAEAARALAKAGQSAVSALPLLAESLTDPDHRVRANVVAALAALDTGEARLLLREIALPHLEEDLAAQDAEVRTAAAGAAAHLGADALPVLVSALRNADDSLRFAIMLSLRRLEAAGHGAVRALISLLDTQDSRTRRNVLYTLQDLGTPEALEVVRLARIDVVEDPLDRMLRMMEAWARRQSATRSGPYRLAYGVLSRYDGEPLVEPADQAARAYSESAMAHLGERLAEHPSWEVFLEQDAELDGLILRPETTRGAHEAEGQERTAPMEVVFERASRDLVLVIGGE